MARSFSLSALFSEQLDAPQLCSLEILGWLGASGNSSLASCSKGYRLHVATFRKNLKKIVLDKHWHHDHFGGLFEHRHVEELVIQAETEFILTPLPQPLGTKHFDWDGGKVWRLINLNSSTLKRVIFKSVVLAEPDRSQVPDDDINAERFEVYFHHLYRCASLETLEIQAAPPPDRFPINSFVREVFGRLRHLELSAGDYVVRFDHEEFGECVARALREAQQLETLFLNWHPWDHDAERGDFAFIEVWESTTLPSLRRLRLRGDVLYREDCDGISQFLNRHSHTMERLQLQLSNRVATSDRNFVCPEQMFPHLGSLPKLKELVVPLPKTYAGNELMRDHASIVPRMRLVCMPLLQIQAKCPSLECLIFLAEVEHAPVQMIRKEIGHVEVSRVICETQQLFLRDGKQQLQTVYFLECPRSMSAPRICIDDVPLDLETTLGRHGDTHQQIHAKIDAHREEIDNRTAQLEAHLQKQDEDLHKEVNDRIDGVERHHSNISKETSKRLNALDLRIAGLQGASGESKRDIGKLRDEVNNLTVKSAAHDVDIGKNSDDLRKLERQRIEDNQRHKQDVDGIYEELDQKVYEKNFQSLEENVTKLTRGTVKLCQVVGVFPGARMNDGTEEELDVDVELLNWEDCAQNLVSRVDKTWRQISSQKYRSILDLLGKKADHSVLRLLQISQQHIESQLDRVRHERELWKEVVDKRAQQPLQLALTLKDPHTGQPLPGPPGYGLPGLDGNPMAGPLSGRGLPGGMTSDPMQLGPSGQGMGPDQPKASPLAKRIARPQPGPPAPKAST